MTLSRVAFLLLGTLALLLAHIQPTSATRRDHGRDVPKTWLCPKGKYSRYNSFEIFELTEGSQITPAPENGASYQPGEEYYYKDPLVSYWKGESAPEQIGSVSGTCFVYEIIALPSSNKNYCINTYSFDGQGTIATTGDFIDRTGDVGVEAITGGTGKFKGASGEVRTTIIEQGRKFKHEFHLTSPFYCK